MESQFDQFEQSTTLRKDLIPTWIKVFSWLFLITGILGLFGLLSYVFNPLLNINIYDINLKENSFILSMFSTLIIIFNGFTAYLILKKEDKAIEIARINALIGIVICITSTFLNLYLYDEFKIRIEIIFIWFFYKKMDEIKLRWLTASK